MNVGDVIKTNLDNDGYIESLVLLTRKLSGENNGLF